MDHHHPQQQQYSDPYRALVPSPQPDHVHALQYHHQTQPPQATSPQPQHHHASLVSHFHLLHHLTGVGMQGHVQASSSGFVTRLADAIGTGTRDQSFDVLVEELTSQFARCQQLLNSISGTLSSKSITVEGQRQSLEETRQLLDQRKDLITRYRSSVEDLLKGNTR